MEAKVTQEEAAAMDDVRREFPRRVLDPDRAFGDGGSTYLDTESFRAGVRGKCWDELDAAFLEYHHDALAFFSPSSFADYLPAYLGAMVDHSAAVRNIPIFLRGELTRSGNGERFDARIGPLSVPQRRAIARTLAAIEAAETADHRRADMVAVLDSYWREYL